MPARIEALEAEQLKLQARVSGAAFYQQPAGEIATVLAQLESIAENLEEGYARWEELEAQANRLRGG